MSAGLILSCKGKQGTILQYCNTNVTNRSNDELLKRIEYDIILYKCVKNIPLYNIRNGGADYF